MTLIQAIEAGVVLDVPKVFDKQIESDLAKLYFSGEYVYKVYKSSNNYFTEFAQPSIRIPFLADDMLWNSTLSPELYPRIMWMKNSAGEWQVCEKQDAEDAIFVIKKISSPNLTELLRENSVSQDELLKIVHTMTERTDDLTAKLRANAYALEDQSWEDRLVALLKGAKAWAELADPLIPKNWSRETIDTLVAYAEGSSYIRDFPRANLAAALDCHSDNIFLVDAKPEFLDSMLPNTVWRVVDPFCNTSKLAVDVTVYSDTAVRDTLYDGYATFHELPPNDVQLFYEATYAMLKGVYVALIGPKEKAPEYRAIVDRAISELS